MKKIKIFLALLLFTTSTTNVVTAMKPFNFDYKEIRRRMVRHSDVGCSTPHQSEIYEEALKSREKFVSGQRKTPTDMRYSYFFAKLEDYTIGMTDDPEFEHRKKECSESEEGCRPLEYQANYGFLIRNKLFPMLTRYFHRYGVVFSKADFDGWIKGCTFAEESISIIRSNFEKWHSGFYFAYQNLDRIKAIADHGHPAGEDYLNISKMLSDLSKLVQVPSLQGLVVGCFNMMDSMITMQDFR